MYPLSNVPHIEQLASTRTNDLSEPIEPYLQIANELEATNRYEFISRAKFIREQCEGREGKELFDKYREDWSIWNFPEDLVTVEDFRRGFLWRFRDHTTSWIANQQAKTWFLTSPDGLFVRRYEFWTYDNLFEECIEVREGSYKEILLSLLNDEDYEVLCSPAFTKAELHNFINNYKPANGDINIEDIIEEYIVGNPNFDEIKYSANYLELF